MALIGKLRERMGAILAVSIGFSLMAFVLGDILTSGTSLFADSKTDIGKIAGESVSAQEFENKFQQNVEVYKQNNKVENVDAGQLDNIREQTWNQLINETIFNKVYDDLGVAVSTDELWDMVQGKFLHPKIKEVPFFNDSITHQFKPDAVVKYLNNIQDDAPSMNQWLQFEDGIKKERISQKYLNLIKEGLYVTKKEAEQNKKESDRTAKVSYFSLLYKSIPDSSVTVTDSELKTYYNQHEEKYKLEESTRKIEYIAFDIAPSNEDYSVAQRSLTQLVADFKATANDSEFVMLNSDKKEMSGEYISTNSIPQSVSGTAATSPNGTVLGPYMENKAFKLLKIVDSKEMPDSVKARHVLIRFPAGSDTAKALARVDSIKKAIKSGKGKFADLAEKLSDDPGSGKKGGDLGWFREGMMVKPFNDACFNGKKGDMPVVISQFGVHLIEIMEVSQKSKRIKTAVIEKAIETSTKTDRDIYAKANAFAAKYNTAELFNQGVADEKLNKRVAENVKENDRAITGLESPRELVRWAYRSKQGDISKVLQFGNMYVIAIVAMVNEKGIAPFDNVKEPITAEVKKEKKAKMLADKINTNSAGVTGIAALAPKVGAEVQSSDKVSFSTGYFGTQAHEGEVVGTIFSLKKGEMSKPIQGILGVYVVQVDDITEAPATADLSAAKHQLASNLKSRVDYQVFQALKEKAAVKDNRSNFY